MVKTTLELKKENLKKLKNLIGNICKEIKK